MSAASAFAPVSTLQPTAPGVPMTTAALIIAMVNSCQGASDLIFSPGRMPQVEGGGQLSTPGIAGLNVLTPHDTAKIATDLVGQNSVAAQSLKNEGSADLSFSIPQVSRFRVNIFRQRGTYAIVMRVIAAKIPTFEELQLPEELKKIALLTTGAVLVTGPTGSGKSSTLAAIIDLINSTRAVHIITIEDPIEFMHPQESNYSPARTSHRYGQLCVGFTGGDAASAEGDLGWRNEGQGNHRDRTDSGGNWAPGAFNAA